jgi:16S rRNA (uracil1498-N3)-methyltransferase
VSSGEKMDFTVQKAVELGVAAIQPVVTERAVVRLSGERAERKTEHWRRVAVAACEQCGRNMLPEVAALTTLERWLGDLAPPAGGELRLMLSPHAANGLRRLPAPRGPVTLLAGPEGGLTEAEQGIAGLAGFVPVRLGARVLRTETAALAALAAMQALWGDF